MEAIAEHSPPRRRWLQFSLRGMLLVVVVAAIGFSVWTSRGLVRENRRLQGEIKQLKDERGEFYVERGKEHKLHVMAVPTVEAMTWKWQVHVPEGRVFKWKAAVSDIQLEGLPKSGDGQNLPAGDYLIKVTLVRADSKNAMLRVDCKDSPLYFDFRGASAWIEQPGFVISKRAGDGQTDSVEPGAVLELIRFLSMVFDEHGKEAADRSGGFMVWICDEPAR